jgi:hypothetical protein
LNRKPPTIACVILLAVGATIGLGMLSARDIFAATAQGGIIINGSDYNLTLVTTNSSDLTNATQIVTARIITDYSDFSDGLNLQESDSLNQTATAMQPRIIIEYADYAATLDLSPYLGPAPYPNDTSSPSIVVARDPSEPQVPEGQSVVVSANVTDAESGVENATLQYTTDNSTNWSSANTTTVPMSLNGTLNPQNSSALYFNATIPGQSSGTRVRFRIIAYDFAGNSATVDGVIDITTYLVVPEFPLIALLSLFMIATLGTVVVYRGKHSA